VGVCEGWGQQAGVDEGEQVDEHQVQQVGYRHSWQAFIKTDQIKKGNVGMYLWT